MIDFLIKSSLCLLLLLAVYNLFLEKEKMNVFNRIYLLASLEISFVIPLVKFEISHESLQQHLIPNTIQVIQQKAIVIENNSDYSALILWSLYLLITSLFLFRFVKNLFGIIRKIQSNPKEKLEDSTLVLVEEKILPHTFMNYIFINKKDYENRNIEEELYTHELTHVRQKHTLDIIVIELLKTIFWFNPILIFYKKAIQLNHEFLADEKVVKSHNNVPFYQSLLLEKASWNSNFYLASNLNFSVTKKRLIMMTKTTSKSTALFKKLSLLPILAGLLFISSTQNSIAQTKPVEKTATEVPPVKFADATTQPEFPGGMAEFYKFVEKEFKIPADFKGRGNIITSFIIETDGSLTDINIVRDLGYGTGEEAVKLLKKSPKWKPGFSGDKAVRVQYHLPIKLSSTN